MSQFENFFNEIQNEIEKDQQQKAQLQELEHKFDVQLIPLKNYINELTSCTPGELNYQFHRFSHPLLMARSNLQEFMKSLNDLNCKPVQKERLLNKFMEESIYLTLTFRYIQVIEDCFSKVEEDIVRVPFTDTPETAGVIMSPAEVIENLELIKIDYQLYMLALLRLVDLIVDYTSRTVIRLAIDSNSVKDYTLALINSEIVSKLQKGYQLLDLKNDNLRKKYDGLKYNSQRLNKIVYDLSLRSLISFKGELV